MSTQLAGALERCHKTTPFRVTIKSVASERGGAGLQYVLKGHQEDCLTLTADYVQAYLSEAV